MRHLLFQRAYDSMVPEYAHSNVDFIFPLKKLLLTFLHSLAISCFCDETVPLHAYISLTAEL